MYHGNGQLEETCTYKNGLADGPCEGYYENGQLYYKYTFKKGDRVGVAEEYDEQGRLVKKGVYKQTIFGKKSYEGDVNVAASVERNRVNEKLKQFAKQMPPSALRKAAIWDEVAEFRKKYPKKGAGRAPRKPRPGKEM